MSHRSLRFAPPMVEKSSDMNHISLMTAYIKLQDGVRKHLEQAHRFDDNTTSNFEAMHGSIENNYESVMAPHIKLFWSEESPTVIPQWFCYFGGDTVSLRREVQRQSFSEGNCQDLVGGNGDSLQRGNQCSEVFSFVATTLHFIVATSTVEFCCSAELLHFGVAISAVQNLVLQRLVFFDVQWMHYSWFIL